MIKSWTTLEWYLPPETGPLPHFNLVGTQVRDDGSSTGFRAGDTVWVAEDAQGQAGLAWEWIEVQPGVVMLADPNSIITNLQIVDSHNGPVSGLAKTIAVNRLVHALPWQQSVCTQLQGDAVNMPRALQALAQRRPLQSQPARPENGAAAASQAPAPEFLALRAPAANPAPHTLQGANRRLWVDTGVRAHSRSSDHEPVLDRRGLRDLRRAA